ncbi:hypothetical protein FA10DRAFT_258718 [Acaromyces ingoldii]|uniref:Uncharacterized protein n=1 Tax=Acaromyces ingoldii TaxID=215250 RepID=A0A316YQ03_9BASI|nr:hypothetical protein FA10DRAFT_258718 [Acaromyces ingoldii]PWN91311.1 hypothetical protein FA10DRAFT_258718 [Acaromyces ingoldii]
MDINSNNIFNRGNITRLLQRAFGNSFKAYKLRKALKAYSAVGAGPQALRGTKLMWLKANTKRTERKKAQIGQGEKESRYFREKARHPEECTFCQTRRILSNPRDKNLIERLKTLRLDYWRNRDQRRRGSFGFPTRTQQRDLLALFGKWMQQNTSLPEPVREEEFDEQFEQANWLLTSAFCAAHQIGLSLDPAEREFLTALFEKRGKALLASPNPEKERRRREGQQMRERSLLPSEEEETWLKDTFRAEASSRYNDQDEGEIRWRRLSALLTLAMGAFEFNQPPITEPTRVKLRHIFQNIVVGREHEMQLRKEGAEKNSRRGLINISN